MSELMQSKRVHNIPDRDKSFRYVQSSNKHDHQVSLIRMHNVLLLWYTGCKVFFRNTGISNAIVISFVLPYFIFFLL